MPPHIDLRHRAHRREAHSRRAILPGGAVVVESSDRRPWVTVRISGELDRYDELALVDALTGSVLGGARHLVVDLGDVVFADLSIVRAMDRVRRFLARSGGTFELRNARPQVDMLWGRLAAA